MSEPKIRFYRSNLLQTVRTGKSQFLTILGDGPEAIEPHPLLEHLADGVALLMITAGAVASLFSAALFRRRPKFAGPLMEFSCQSAPARDTGDDTAANCVSEFWLHVDSKFRYMELSPAFCGLLGLQCSDLMGRSAEDITPGDFVDIEAARGKLRQQGRTKGIWVYRHRDGHLIPVTYVAKLRPDSSALAYVEPIRFVA